MKLKMRACLSAIALGGLCGLSHADVAYVNSNKAPVNSVLATGAYGEYHIRNSGYDMSLHPAAGSSINGFQSADLGNNTWLSMRSYDVYFSYTKGVGFSFVMHNFYRTELTIPLGKSNASGGGGDGGGDGSGGGGGGGGAPANYYNAIRWDMFSTRSNAAAHTKFAYFTFTSPDVQVVDGAFYNGDASAAQGKPHQQQWIVSNGNLLDHNWTAFGRVQCFLDTTDNRDDDAIGFSVSLLAVDTPVAPAPGAAALLGVAGVVGVRRRR